MHSPPRILHRLALILFTLALQACSAWPTGPLARESKELDRNRRLWEAQRLPSYRYQIVNFCFCLDEYRGPVAVEVDRGVTLSAKYVSSGAPARPEPFGSMDTVDELFDTIARALARRPDEVEVVYDPDLGYPRSAQFDFESRATDEEGGFSVTGFQRR